MDADFGSNSLTDVQQKDLALDTQSISRSIVPWLLTTPNQVLGSLRAQWFGDFREVSYDFKSRGLHRRLKGWRYSIYP